MNNIYVLMSFTFSSNEKTISNIKRGRRFWYDSLFEVEKYLELAGKPVIGQENCYYDDPCEHKYNYIIIEKVPSGPFPINEIISWWKAYYKDNRLSEIIRLKKSPIQNIEHIYNITE